jgi:hypothetical protein
MGQGRGQMIGGSCVSVKQLQCCASGDKEANDGTMNDGEEKVLLADDSGKETKTKC